MSAEQLEQLFYVRICHDKYENTDIKYTILKLTFPSTPRWVMFPCQNFLENPLMEPVTASSNLKPGCQQSEPYPKTHSELLLEPRRPSIAITDQAKLAFANFKVS